MSVISFRRLRLRGLNNSGSQPYVSASAKPQAAILLLLTLFAAIIRFYNLSHPCLWYDESMVFWRTCGTYGQLLNCLRTDGFVPLHYSLIWVLSRFFRPTPFLLRFVPALCGTLMVPAVYFLARQLVRIKTALLAAAFAACSGFLLFYSRDAKMYMDAWLFVTLNMACLLWWFRTKMSTAWLCWIATGCAAVGLHASSSIPIAISLLLLFTQSKMRWQQTLLWLLGMLIIFAGPLGYYEKFNRWEDRVDEEGWKDSGLTWIGAYNHGRSDSQLVRYFATSTLMGWEWPKDEDLKLIPEARFTWPRRGAETLFIILLICCLPWPRCYRPKPVLRYAEEPDIEPEKYPALRNTSEPASPEPQWRVVLWLSFWIILPTYSFYVRSVPNFATPKNLEDFLHPTRLRIVFAGALIAALIGLMVRYPQLRPKVYRGLKLLFVAATILALCQGIAAVASMLSKAATGPWQSIWVPRYIGFIWPTLAIAVAALIMRLPTAYVRATAIIFLLSLNLTVAAYRILGQTEPPVDLMAADQIDSENPAHHTLAWLHLKRGMQYPGGGNLFSGPGEYYLHLLGNKPTNPKDFRNSIREQARTIYTFPLRRKLPADLAHFIIWNQYDPVGKSPPPDAPPPGWKLESETWFNVRDCWIYQDLAKYQRRTFIKQ